MDSNLTIDTVPEISDVLDELDDDMERFDATVDEDLDEFEIEPNEEFAQTQALVPWTIAENHWMQRTEIDNWMDDQGRYPRTYRSYSREEWRAAIVVLADAVAGLPERDAEYQHLTGLYVEEQTDDMLLVVGKKWQLYIQIPAKASKSGKKLELTAPAGRQDYSFTSERPKLFAEFLTTYVPEDQRDMLLDICCQYMRELRIHVNRAVWAAEHPDLAGLLEESRRS